MTTSKAPDPLRHKIMTPLLVIGVFAVVAIGVLAYIGIEAQLLRQLRYRAVPQQLLLLVPPLRSDSCAALETGAEGQGMGVVCEFRISALSWRRRSQQNEHKLAVASNDCLERGDAATGRETQRYFRVCNQIGSSSMSAEPRRVTHTEVWAQRQSQIVNGVFPLRRFLGASNHSAVFLTEYQAKNLPDAAIKFVAADALQAEAQLVQWRAAAERSHPHLVRLFEVGRCQLDGRDYLFVVMEYAEQTLAQILRHRALSPEEVREVLLPTLDALAFLHRNQLLHGQLKPSNLLAVNDQLKLASDTVRPTGHCVRGTARTSAYDPPELKDHGYSTAGDVWGLGMTLVEALTQRTTGWPDEPIEPACLPANFPVPFGGTVRRCLSLAPANRPTVIELQAQYKPASQAHPILDPPPPAPESPPQGNSPQRFPKRHFLRPVIAAALLISLAVWIGLRFSGPSQVPLQPRAAAPSPVAPSTVEKPHSALPSPASHSSDQSSLPPAATSAAALHEVIPDVPRTIREKIKGHVRITVRVLVDPSGNVVGTLMENAGPSRYFARLADQAAGEWKFAPADNQGARVWLLRFAFGRDGVTVRATAVP